MSVAGEGHLRPVRLYPETAVTPPVTKVGILPFSQGKGTLLEFLFMKPSAEAKHLGAPTFQIAKGTRRINISGDWCDMREDDLRFADESFHETLLATALREGREEIGLKAENIRRVYDMGGFTFISASRNIKKPIHIFAAEILDRADFDAFEATTAEARWMAPEEFIAKSRADHAAIVKEVAERLLARQS